MKPVGPPAAQPRLRVLVVDDEPAIRDPLVRYLRQHGCAVAEAADGVRALLAIREANFDAVVSDVSMPGLDGATLWMRGCMIRPALRDRWVFVSALPLPRVLEAARQVYVRKPFDLEALWDAVQMVTARPRQP